MDSQRINIIAWVVWPVTSLLLSLGTMRFTIWAASGGPSNALYVLALICAVIAVFSFITGTLFGYLLWKKNRKAHQATFAALLATAAFLAMPLIMRGQLF